MGSALTQRSAACLVSALLLASPSARGQDGAAAGASGEPEGPRFSTPPEGKADVDLSERPADQMPGRDPNDPFIPVDDPMLAPVPPAGNVLKRWQDALSIVRSRNPDIKRAYAQILIAQGQSRQTLSASLPVLTTGGNLRLLFGTGQGEAVGQSDPLTQYSHDVTLRVPLFASRDWYDRGTAKRIVKVRELQSKDTERLVVGGLAEAIVAVITAERLSEVTRVNLAASLSSLELNRKRARLGAANAVDVLRAEQEVATSRSQVIESDETLRRSREALGLSLGHSTAWGVVPEISLDRLREDARQTCTPGDDIRDRPDVQAAEENKAVAARNVKSVNFDYLPTVSASAQVNYTTIPQFAFSQNNFTWNLGGVLSWNLYDGGFRYGEKKAQKGNLETAQQDLNNLQNSAQIEVTQSLRGVEVATRNLEVSKQSREIAVQNARLARIRFVNGTGTSFDMIQTQSAANQAIIDVTIKEFELLQAQIAAFLAMASCDL